MVRKRKKNRCTKIVLLTQYFFISNIFFKIVYRKKVQKKQVHKIFETDNKFTIWEKSVKSISKHKKPKPECTKILLPSFNT